MTVQPPDTAAPTPGPWEIATHSGGDGHEIDIQKPSGGGWFLRLSPGYPFAEFPDPEEVRAEFEANVRLIAAAPATAAERDRLVEVNEGLVKALEAAIDFLDSSYSKEREAFIAADAALAKARTL